MTKHTLSNFCPPCQPRQHLPLEHVGQLTAQHQPIGPAQILLATSSNSFFYPIFPGGGEQEEAEDVEDDEDEDDDEKDEEDEATEEEKAESSWHPIRRGERYPPGRTSPSPKLILLRWAAASPPASAAPPPPAAAVTPALIRRTSSLRAPGCRRQQKKWRNGGRARYKRSDSGSAATRISC